MHRRQLSLIAVLAASASLLFGEVWESNALSMRLEAVPEIGPDGYYLVAEDGHESLFLDGNLIRERTRDENGFTVVENGIRTTCSLDSAGRPVRIETDGTAVSNTYSRTGLLLSSTFTGKDGLETITEYHWSPEGKLMYVEEVDVSYYLPSTKFHYACGDDSFAINDDTPEVFIEKLGAEKAKVEVVEGNVTMTSPDGSVRTYSPDGLLVHEEKDGSIIDYMYEDGIMTESTEIRGDSLSVRHYESGILSSREFFVDGVKTREQVFPEDGSLVEYRYRNGKAYVRVYYDRDHRTIRSMESL